MSLRSLVVALLLAGLSVAPSAPDSSCDADLRLLIRQILELARGSEAAHARLLQDTRRLLAHHANAPAACRSGLHREEIALTNYVDDYAEAIRLSSAYLASDLGHAFPMDRAFVLRVRGYARESLGETVAGAQDYFEAASLARRMPVVDALQALLDAAETAVAMGDVEAADRYHAGAEALVLDSLPGRPEMRLRLGRLLGARAELLTVRMNMAADSADRRRYARRLAAVADSAAAVLSGERDQSWDLPLDLANEAMAHSARAVAASELGDTDAGRDALAEAMRLLEASNGASRDAGYQVWMRASSVRATVGDTVGAWQAALQARTEARNVGVLPNEATAVEQLGMLAEALGRLDEAEARFREAVALREVERERLELQDWSVSAFATSQTPYRELARLLARRGRTVEAFQILDQSRARHLRELRAQVRLRSVLSPGGRRRVDSLLTAIEAVRLDQLRSTEATSEARTAAQLSRLQAALARETGLEGGPPPQLDVRALQESLRQRRRVLVSYFVNEPLSLAFVVTPDTVAALDLPIGRRALLQTLDALQGPWAPTPDPAVALAPLHALHEALIRPLTALLPEDAGLIVIPDGPLADLPFAMLVEAPSQSYADARYLVRRRALATELAAALIVEPRGPSSADVDLVAFGRSEFTRSAAGAARDEPLGDLPFVADEIARVARHARRRIVALNDDATEPALARAMERGRIVHLASHARADASFPMHSEIRLWPSDDDDGVLHLYEVQTAQLPAQLVVLSGCSTAEGAHRRGEGTLGLHYGLRAAGARATLATLWAIDDRAMADVMDSFYAALAEGMPKDDALRTAQLAYLDAHDGLQASPFYWAPLVLSGDVAAVPLVPRRPWLALAAGLALAGLAWGATRRLYARRSAPAV